MWGPPAGRGPGLCLGEQLGEPAALPPAVQAAGTKSLFPGLLMLPGPQCCQV